MGPCAENTLENPVIESTRGYVRKLGRSWAAQEGASQPLGEKISQLFTKLLTDATKSNLEAFYKQPKEYFTDVEKQVPVYGSMTFLVALEYAAYIPVHAVSSVVRILPLLSLVGTLLDLSLRLVFSVIGFPIFICKVILTINILYQLQKSLAAKIEEKRKQYPELTYSQFFKDQAIELRSFILSDKLREALSKFRPALDEAYMCHQAYIVLTTSIQIFKIFIFILVSVV